jgi:hypothetical protein
MAFCRLSKERNSMIELIKSLLEEIDHLDNLLQSRVDLGLEHDYTRGRMDGYMKVLEELVKVFNEERGN